MKRLFFLIFAIVAICACEERTSSILSSGKLEDVLYDYHLAQAMIEELNGDDRSKMSQAYIDAVFEKHHITEAEFDSSMIYYNRNSKILQEIYSNIQERYQEENQQLALTTGNDVMTALSLNGDTANIWNASSLIVLRCKEGINHETFTITADSSFHRQDKFTLFCNPVMICETMNDPNTYIMVGLSVNYKNGKTTASTMRVSTPHKYQIMVNAKEGEDIASVSGFFYFTGNKSMRNIALVSGIGLIRMHTAIEEPKIEITDSLSDDSIKKSSERVIREHLTPEQMRQKNQSDNRIKIKEAPDVRTPNSVGPRRRTNRFGGAKPAQRF